jgi:hypothetical protein
LIFEEKEVLEDVEELGHVEERCPASSSCPPQYVMLHFVTPVLQDLTVVSEKEVLEDVEELGHVEEVQHPPPAPLAHPTVLVQRLTLSRSHRLRINSKSFY